MLPEGDGKDFMEEVTFKQIIAFLFCGMRASHCCGLSCCRAQAPDAQAQRPWLTGPAALRHVGSSQPGARTHVPCIGRWTLNHCATREAPKYFIFIFQLSIVSV